MALLSHFADCDVRWQCGWHAWDEGWDRMMWMDRRRRGFCCSRVMASGQSEEMEFSCGFLKVQVCRQRLIHSHALHSCEFSVIRGRERISLFDHASFSPLTGHFPWPSLPQVFGNGARQAALRVQLPDNWEWHTSILTRSQHILIGS